MKFITVEQFKKQSKEVQEFLKNRKIDSFELVQADWRFDVEYFQSIELEYSSIKGRRIDTYQSILKLEREFRYIGGLLEFDIIKLWTEGELRSLIEEITGGIVEPCYYGGCTGYDVDIIGKSDLLTFYSKSDLGNDLLQALWIIACNIIDGDGGF